MRNQSKFRKLVCTAALLAAGFFAAPAQADVTVNPTPNNPNPVQGDTVCVQVNVGEVANLYAASFDMLYNNSVLSYQGITHGGFMGTPEETMMLVSSQDNQIVAGISRKGDIGGVSGSGGTLATLCFRVTGSYCTASDITFGNAYLEGPAQDSIIAATWNQANLTVTLLSPTGVATADAGSHDQINLSWSAVTGADTYEVYRSHTSGGTYSLMGTSVTNFYEDANCILPTLAYYYQVKAVSGGSCISQLSPEVSGLAAGLLGDINNDGRVNGRDLSRLARKFGTSDDCRADLDRSGLIDGDDLSLLAADFGKTL